MSLKSATQLMSIITIVCGFSGTLAGSLIIDQRMAKHIKEYEVGLISQENLQYISVEKSSFYLFFFIFLATLFSVTGSILGSFYYYITGFTISVIFIFA